MHIIYFDIGTQRADHLGCDGYHVRGQLAGYLESVRQTGRQGWAEHLERAYPDDV